MDLLIGLVEIVINILVLYFVFRLNKSLEKYKSEQQKYLNVLFRDEDARTSVTSNIIATGDKERIRIYKMVYELYFKVFRSRVTIKIGDDNYKGLVNEIKDVKTDIMINSVYLGGLLEHLIEATNRLPDDLESIAGNDRGEYKGDKSFNELQNATKWIADNMKPYLTLNRIDLSENTRDKIKEQLEKYAKQQLT